MRSRCTCFALLTSDHRPASTRAGARMARSCHALSCGVIAVDGQLFASGIYDDGGSELPFVEHH